MGQHLTGKYSAVPVEEITLDEVQIPEQQYQISNNPRINNDLRRILEDKPVINTESLSRKHQTIHQKLRNYVNTANGNDFVDSKWYGWESLHYAAWTSNPAILRGILSKIPRERVNTLNFLSENALHILLSHGIQTETFNLSEQNGFEEKVCKIVTKETPNVIECVQILLEYGIDINHGNFWNETPILLAIRRKYIEIIKLLLKSPDIDLDSCKDTITGKSPRELLKGKDFGMLPKHGSNRDTRKVLFQLLKSGDEEAFLRKNIAGFADSCDGDSEDTSSCTLLQYCFKRSFLICTDKYRKMVDSEGEDQHDIINNKFVEIFCKYGMVKCIEHLLDNGATIDKTLRKFQKPLLQLATLHGFYPFLCVVLSHSKIKQLDICEEILHCVKSCRTNENHTLTILLNRVANLNQQSPEQNQMLQKALLLGYRKKISDSNLLSLLNLVGCLSLRNEKIRKYILEDIDADVINLHLDECVEEIDQKNVINYNSFHKDDTELKAMEMFMDVESLNKFVNHFVFKILVNRKWNELKIFNVKYFYINLFFYFFFHFVLHLFILLKFNKNNGVFLDLLQSLSWICLVVFSGKEIVQLLTDTRKYLSEITNWFEIIFTIVIAYTLSCPNDVIMVVSVVTSNLVLLLHLQHVPSLTQYVLILGTVIFYLKYVLFYFIQFVSFAICFYILFYEDGQSLWPTLLDRVFQTLILFTGNLDYMTTKDEFGKHEVVAKLVFTFFTIFIAIILNNLLMGLLVTDMGEIKAKVKLSEQLRRTRFVLHLEQFLNGKFLRNCPSFAQKNMSRLKIFDNEFDKSLTVNDNDLEMLDDDEKEHLDGILERKSKRRNIVKKLYSHIRMTNARSYYL